MNIVEICANQNPAPFENVHRPGRLDKLVYCGVPSARERASIARAQASGFDVAPQQLVWLENFALSTTCAGWTGADFKALLASANILRMRRQTTSSQLLKETVVGSSANSDDNLTQGDLEEAAKELRPSLPARERQRFEAIYSEFAGDKKGIATNDRGTAPDIRQQKTVQR